MSLEATTRPLPPKKMSRAEALKIIDAARAAEGSVPRFLDLLDQIDARDYKVQINRILKIREGEYTRTSA